MRGGDAMRTFREEPPIELGEMLPLACAAGAIVDCGEAVLTAGLADLLPCETIEPGEMIALLLC